MNLAPTRRAAAGGVWNAWICTGLVLLISEGCLAWWTYGALRDWAVEPWPWFASMFRTSLPWLLLMAACAALVSALAGQKRHVMAASLVPAAAVLLGGWAAVRFVYPTRLRVELGTMVAAIGIAAATLGIGWLGARWATRARWRWRVVPSAGVTFGVLGLWMLSAASPVPPARAAAPAPVGPSWGGERFVGRDVVLVTVDTVRASHMSLFGYARSTTPGIDDWASDATVFERATSVRSFTAPSIASIFTGKYPETHGVGTHPGLLADGNVTLAEAFRAAGYETAAFVINPALRSPRVHFDQGFDHWTPYDNSTRAGTILEDARTFLAEPSAAPRFTWIHLLDAHTPYLPPEPWNARFRGDALYGELDGVQMHRSSDLRRRFLVLIGGRQAPFELNLIEVLGGRYESLGLSDAELDDADFFVSQYDGEIAYLDSELGPFLRELRSRPDEPVVALVADHGESMVEHGSLFGHGEFAYQTTAHVPLLVRIPDGLGRRVHERVSQVDVFPTLADLMGLDVDPTEGISLAAVIGSPAGEAPALPARAIRTGARSTVSYPTLSLIDGALKIILKPVRWVALMDALVVNQVPAGAVPHLGLRWYQERLFDLSADPGELQDLAPTRPADAERLRSTLFQQLLVSEQLAVASSGTLTLDEETRRQLRALGYVR